MSVWARAGRTWMFYNYVRAESDPLIFQINNNDLLEVLTCLCSELNKGRHQVRGRYGVHLPASAVVQPSSALTKWELLTTLSAVKSDLQKLRCNDWVLDNGLQETCWDDIGKLCFVAVIKQFWLTLTLLQSPVSALSSLSSPGHLNLTLSQGFIQHELFYLSISLISLFTMWQNLRTGDSWVLCGVVCRVCGGNECLVSGLHGGGCRVRDRPPLSCYYTTHCSGLGCRGQYGHLHTDYKYTLTLCLGNPGLLAQCVRGSVLYTALATPQPGGYLPGCHHSREWLSALTTQEVINRTQWTTLSQSQQHLLFKISPGSCEVSTPWLETWNVYTSLFNSSTFYWIIA